MNQAKIQLKKLSNLVEHDVEGLIEFYGTRVANANKSGARFTWPELMQLYRSRPSITEREVFEMKGLGAAMMMDSSSLMSSVNNELGDSGLGSMESSSVMSKTTTKAAAKEARGGKKKKVKKKEKPEMIKEKTEPPGSLALGILLLTWSKKN